MKWANENVVVLIAHNELGHDELEPEKEGGEPRCPLYPGLRCRDHLNIAVDTENSREEHLPRVPFLELCPNSWLIAPTGGFPEHSASTGDAKKEDGEKAKGDEPADDKYAPVRPISEKDQFTSKGIRTQVGAVQKHLGETLSYEVGQKIYKVFAEAERHAERDDWAGVMAALATLEKHVKKAPLSLRRLMQERLADVSEEIGYVLEDQRDEKDVAGARKLLQIANIKVFGLELPVRKEIEAWLKTAAPK